MFSEEKHSSSNIKTLCSKEQKIYEKLWVVLEHGKRVFFGLFLGFNVIVVCCFFLSGKVARVFQMLVFPVLGAFVGWFILVCLGLEGLGAFVFLVFVLLLCVGFVSVLFALFLFCCWMLLFCLCFSFFLFLFVCCFLCFFFWRV